MGRATEKTVGDDMYALGFPRCFLRRTPHPSGSNDDGIQLVNLPPYPVVAELHDSAHIQRKAAQCDLLGPYKQVAPRGPSSHTKIILARRRIVSICPLPVPYLDCYGSWSSTGT